ncbi:MAG: hypothetical protein C0190_02940 [Thermodesulfobacterium geofontis]|uniref:Uncharacterized protein n=1 Tax=Thermodesulfobacterium geofontis TaxID=1295609 RepID=A0A2N7PP71_9BACT|nr:MAG: hypothetical protein C0190_02940 [Thermodesulfobacterium geofontis]
MMSQKTKFLIFLVIFLIVNFGFIIFSKAESLNLLNNQNLSLISENSKGEKLFYLKDSLKKISDSKLEVNLLYLPKEDISKRCEDYWIYWRISSEMREYLWISLEKEELDKCRSLKYAIYKWQIDCKKRTYKEKDWGWYDEKGNSVYTRRTVGISFISIPKDLIEELFENLCK